MSDFADRLGAFSSERLNLRVLKSEDAPSLQVVTNDRAITDVISFLEYPFVLRDAQALIERFSSDNERAFGIWTKSNSQLAGLVGAHLGKTNQIEIGYWVGTAFQGKGIAYEAASSLLLQIENGFPEFDVFAECAPDNKASQHLLVKLGFRTTGRDGQRDGRKLYAYERRV